MNSDSTEINSKEKSSEEQKLSSKEKRAIYMSQLRGSMDSEYRRIERENNARAMRKKRLENPLYRENERRQNRAHMAEIRRQNAEYRQREHTKNRHRMSLKRTLISQKSSSSLNNSIYEVLENNLQSSHISFIPYETNWQISQQQQNSSSSLDSNSSISSS